MTENRWVGNYDWQCGLSLRETYLHELVVSFEPQMAADVLERLGPLGGAAARLDEDDLVLSSSGQDAIDSLEYAAERLTDIAESIDGSVRITWTERPPLGDAGPAQRIDGYWIPAQLVAGHRDRQLRAFEALVRTGVGVDRWALEEHSGVVVAAAHSGDQMTPFLLGTAQLEMIEEALADGTLADYTTLR